jgi:DNA-binding NarL/FixJ family response regulator
MKRITILIAEDHAIVREGFHRMLELEDDLEVVGEAQDGRQAVEMAKQLLPNVILMDVSMPMLNGLEATRQVTKVLPATKVLILSAHGDLTHITNAMECGASGFLLKQQSSAHEVCRAIREVHQGKTFFNPSISKRLDHFDPPSSGRTEMIKKATELTSREMEVLQLVAEGKANKQTAAELGIGTKTVEKHRGHLMRKLDIHNTAGLTRYAIYAGVIENGVQFATGHRRVAVPPCRREQEPEGPAMNLNPAEALNSIFNMGC